MKLERFTEKRAVELQSWFQKPFESNRFIDYYKDPNEWLILVQSMSNREAFAAIAKHEFIGFIDIEFETDSNVSFALGIRPDLRGNGFGKTLLRKLESYVKQRGLSKLEAGVDKENIACCKLLETSGFTATSIDDKIIQYVKNISH